MTQAVAVRSVARSIKRAVATIGLLDSQCAFRLSIARPLRSIGCATGRCSKLRGIDSILRLIAFGPVLAPVWRVQWMDYRS